MSSSSSSSSLEHILLAMGNPLLDISAEVSDDFLKKYDLKANDAILAGEKHQSLYSDLTKQFKADFVAGGAAQNTIRGAQWILPKNSTSYIGCVGSDEYASSLRKAAEDEGVKPLYMTVSDTPTGTCGVLITGHNRSLVANLAAAEKYQLSHLKSPEIWSYVSKAKYYYISGFFLTVSTPSILEVAKHAAETNKVFTMNLSAPFLCNFFKDQMNSVIPYADYIFGNETEALAYSEANNLGTQDIKEIALKLSQHSKINQKRSRTVVITQGADPVVVAFENEVNHFPIIPIKKEQIVDTNGAGDAFVGGFLSQLVQMKPIQSCISAGNYLANIVIQRTGPTYPTDQKVTSNF